MKKIGSIQFFEDIDFNLKFDFNELMNSFKKDSQGIKDEFINEDNQLKFDIVEKYVKEYVNQKIKDKFGEDFSLDVMDDTMNISWDIKVKSIKEKNIESWWDDKNSSKQLTLEEMIANPNLIPEGLPEHRR